MPEFPSTLAVTGDCPECGCGDPTCRVCEGFNNPNSFNATIALTNFGTYTHTTTSPDINPAYSGNITCASSGMNCIYPLETNRGTNELEWDLFISSGWVALGCFGYADGQTVNLVDTSGASDARCYFDGSISCSDQRVKLVYDPESDTFIEYTTTIVCDIFIELTAISTTNFSITIKNQVTINGSIQVSGGPPATIKSDTVNIVTIGYTCDGSGFASATIPFDTGPLNVSPDYAATIAGTITLTPGI